MKAVLFYILLVATLCSCTTKEAEIKKLFPELEENAEYAYDGYLLYSDSAKVQVKLNYETLKKFREDNESMTEFPDGIFAEFFGPNSKPNSWLTSKYAIRYDKKANIICRDSVVLYNIDGDKLETSELIWDEELSLIRTDKFVRITQPMKGDTSYGYGFRAKQDFSEFEIGKFSGKGSVKGF